MVREPFRLLDDSVSRYPFQHLDNVGMQHTPSLQQETAVGHLMRESMLEGVLEVGEERGLVEKLRCLQTGQLSTYLMLGRVGNRQEQRHWHVLADDRGRLNQSLGRRVKTIDPRGKNGLNRCWHIQVLDVLLKLR